MDTQNNSNSPSQSDIQRQSIQRDIDKHDNNGSMNSGSIIGQHDFNDEPQQGPNQKTALAKLRRKFKPVVKWSRRMHYRLEESSRRRKWIAMGIFATLLVGSSIWGHFDRPSVLISNTSVGKSLDFKNNDSITLDSEKYDKGNHTLQANFTTSSSSGAVSPGDLSAHFVLAQEPSVHGLPEPTLNLIPTFNNHFTVIIHHLYNGFGGVAIMFHDKSKLTINSLVNSDGDVSGNDLSDKEQNEIQNIAQKGSSYKSSEKVTKFLNKMQKNDNSNFIMSESNLLKYHKSYVDPTISPRALAIHDLNVKIKSEQSHIKGNQNYIRQIKQSIQQDQGKIRQINRSADIGDKGNELSSTRSQVQQGRQSISNYNQEIQSLQKSIQTNQQRVTRLQEDVVDMPKVQSPKSSNLFSNSAH